MTEKQLKKRAKGELNSWTCKNCSKKYLPEAPKTPNIEEIKDKIVNAQNAGDCNLETSLSLAAEVGNALLLENGELKQKSIELSTQNSKLMLELQELMNAKIQTPNYQVQLEELAREKEMLLESYNTLVEKFHDLENKLEKEKQMRHQLERIFEEQDQEREESTAKDKAKIKKLLNELEQLNKIKNNLNTDTLTKNLTTTGTQTTEDSLKTVNSNKTSNIVLKELAEVRARQEQMDIAIKNLHNQLGYLNKPECTPSNLNATTASTLNKPRTTYKKKLVPIPDCSNTKNYFSISLQAQRFRNKYKTSYQSPSRMQQKRPEAQQEQAPQQKIYSDPIDIVPRTNKFKVTRSPPITATKLNPGESYLEFYEKFIKQRHSSNQLDKYGENQTSPSPTTTLPNTTRNIKDSKISNKEHFLEQRKKIQVKIKN